MVLINYATKEIVAKIVYYGSGLCGKTTNLQYIYTRLNPKKRGKMISLATEADRTLFFDFLPVELGVVQGFRVRFQLYTVPGQVFYSATRKLVLKGADAVVFVADSQADVLTKNLESLEDMKQNLKENDLDPLSIPLVFQYNKRDLDNVVDIWLLEKKLNFRQTPYFEAVAVDGTGVMETFKEVTNLLIRDLKRKHSLMDTDTIKELPPDIFEQKQEKPPAQMPQKAALETGSGIRKERPKADISAEGIPGLERMSLRDPVQAESFMDDVRKGAPVEDAKQKAERAVGGKAQKEVAPEVGLPAAEREFTLEELAVVEEGGAEVDLAVQETENILGLDPEMPPMMDSDGMAGSSGVEADEGIARSGRGKIVSSFPGPVKEKVPDNPSASKSVQQVDPGQVLARLDRLEEGMTSLRLDMARAVAKMDKPAAGTGNADALAGQFMEFRKKILEAMEGQDRFLLSILEAVKDLKKGSVEADSRVEDILKYIAGKVGDVKDKKKWF